MLHAPFFIANNLLLCYNRHIKFEVRCPMIIHTKEMKRKDFLKQFNKTINFHPRTTVEYPDRQGGVLKISHEVFMSNTSDNFDITKKDFTERMFEANVKEAKNFQNALDNRFKKSYWKYFTDSVYKRCYDDIQNNHKEIIEKLWSPQYAESEINSHLKQWEEKLEETITVPDLSFTNGDSVYVVMLNQQLSMTSMDEEPLIVFREYKINNVRLNDTSKHSFVDYDFSCSAIMADSFKEHTAYNEITIMFDKNNEDKTFELRQGYSNLRLFFDKDEAKKFLEETKQKLIMKISD